MTQAICIPGRHINSSLKSQKMEGSNVGGLNEMNKEQCGMPDNIAVPRTNCCHN